MPNRLADADILKNLPGPDVCRFLQGSFLDSRQDAGAANATRVTLSLVYFVLERAQCVLWGADYTESHPA